MSKSKGGYRAGADFEETIKAVLNTFASKGKAYIVKLEEKKTFSGRGVIDTSPFDFFGFYIYLGRHIPVAFDAKTTAATSLPIRNIKPHQVEELDNVSSLGGKAFLLIEFRREGAIYIVNTDILKEAKRLGRKSISVDMCKRLGVKVDKLPNLLEVLNTY